MKEETKMKCLKHIKDRLAETLGKVRGISSQIKDWKSKSWSVAKKGIENYREKSNLVNITVLLVNAISLMAYCSMGIILAEYEGRKLIFVLSYIAIGILIIVSIWELSCVIGAENLEHIVSSLRGVPGKAIALVRRLFTKPKSLVVFIIIVIVAVCTYHYGHSTNCYAELAEIYGIPVGVGQELSPQEQKQITGYWRVDSYWFRPHITLTYVDAYQQMELLREHSTIYNMPLFQPESRIEIDYAHAKDKDKYRFDGLYSYSTAEGNNFREPVCISYYSGRKLLLKLQANEQNALEIVSYSSEDCPQLFNSTLLRIPEGDTVENGILSRQIEITYNADGLPRIRRLKPHIYNLYGINGEQYTYDQDKRLTALCYLDINGEPVCNKLGIMMITFQYDEYGHLFRIRYFSDADGREKTEGFNGVFCEEFLYNNEKLSTRIQRDRSENWCYDKNGVCIYKYTYNAGALVQESFWDITGEIPVQNTSTHSYSLNFKRMGTGNNYDIFISFDVALVEDFPSDLSARTELIMVEELNGSNEEETSENRYDMQEASATDDSSRKYTTIQYTIENGRVAEARYYNDSHELVNCEDGCASKVFKYDPHTWYLIRESYCDADGNPCAINGGYTGINWNYEGGRIKSIQYLNAEQKLTTNKNLGYAEIRFDRNRVGNNEIIQESYWGSSEEPVPLPNLGYAMVERLYSDNGFLMKESYHNETGAVAYRQDYQVAEILYDYTDSGNLHRERYKGANGEPVNRFDTGYAVVYREYEGGQLSRIRYESYRDSLFQASPDKTTGIAAIKYDYSNGKIISEQYFDADGQLALRTDLGCAERRYEYNNMGLLASIAFYDTKGEPTLHKEYGYASVSYKYNTLGQCTDVLYYDTAGSSVINTQYHCAGAHYEYDPQGNRSEVWYLGTDGGLMIRQDYGIAKVVRTYDGAGNLCRAEYQDTEGNLAIRTDVGYAYFVDKFKNGKCTENWYYDTEGHLIPCSNGGYAKAIHTYSDQGSIETSRYYGVDENLTIHTEYLCAGFNYKYDEDGNRSDTWYIGLDNQYMVHSEKGYAHIHSEYDSYGNEKLICYFDADENPAIWKEGGFSSREYEFERGKWTKVSYYGIDGSLVLRHDEGYAVVERDYDERGQYIASRYYDENYERVISNKYNCSGFLYGYDAQGNETDTWYIGTDGKPMVRKDRGYAHYHEEFDSYGRTSTTSYFDVEEKLAISKQTGCATVEYQYDEAGRCILKSYHGIDGTSIISTTDSCAGIAYGYDVKGNQTDTVYLDIDGKPMTLHDMGYAHIRSSFDSAGNKESVCYLDADEKPVNWTAGGFALCEYTIENGRQTEARYYTPDGSLVLRGDEGYAMETWGFDDFGRCISHDYFDTAEKPVINTKYHCMGWAFGYDEVGNQTDIWYRGLNGKFMIRSDVGYAHIQTEYDEFRNEKSVTYFDNEERPTVWKKGGYSWREYEFQNGEREVVIYNNTDNESVLRYDLHYAKAEKIFDEFGQLRFIHYYDTQGFPIIHAEDHCAGYEYVYDERGNQTDTIYLGLDGSPMLRIDKGYAQIHWEYDEFDRCISCTYLDTTGNFSISKEYHCAGFEYTYDTRGNTVLTKYLGLDGGAMVLNGSGYAYIKSEYDAFGHQLWTQYLDADENSVEATDLGYALVKYEHDSSGRITASTYYNVDNEPTNSWDSYCERIEYEYDTTGLLTDVWYCEADGSLIEERNGNYIHYHEEHDKSGNVTAKRFFDANNKPAISQEDGYASVEYLYNKDHRLISETYCGVDKKRIIGKKESCAEIKYEYDTKGNRTDTWYIGLDGQASVCGGRDFAHYHTEYDDAGHQTGVYYFDEKEEPVINSKMGCASIRYAYDAFGRLKKEIYYGVDGKPLISQVYHCAGMKYKYDEAGNRTDTWYLGTDEECIIRDDLGYAHIRSHYDDFGNETWYDYLDTEDKYVESKISGYASYNYSFWIGRQSWEMYCYYGANNSIAPRRDTGVSIETWDYNELGQLTAIRYLDADQNPIFNKDYHCTGFAYAYDERGNETDIYHLGTDSEYMIREEEGYAHRQTKYDAFDNQEFVKYFDKDGSLMIWKEGGYAEVRYEYDRVGRLLKESYLGTAEEPINSVYGYASIEYEYDESGWIKELIYRKADGIVLDI